MELLVCGECGGSMRRSRRKGPEHLLYAAAYRCENCRERVRISHLEHWRQKKYVSCPRCGEHDLKVLERRDRIDRMNRNPFRMLQAMLGGRLYHCGHCRLQFYDLRQLRPGRAKARALSV